MNKEKIMELLKNKKVQLIGSLALCGAIAIGTAFFMINDTKDSTKVDKSVAVENKNEDNKESKNKETKKVSEEEAKKELEELKKADTSKLSNEEKKQTEEKIKSIETMIENKEYEKAQQEVESVKNNVASKVETTVNKVEEKKEEPAKVGTPKEEEKKSEAAKVETPAPAKVETPKVEEKKETPVATHTHSWVDVTEDVVHAEEGHWEEVVVTPEQVKEVPVYETRELSICNGCGADITNKFKEHLETQMLAGNMACSGYHGEWREVQVGTKKEVTPAVTEKKWVVDKEASTETKVVGQKCSGCGAIE